jgi:hypothetical protein
MSEVAAWIGAVAGPDLKKRADLVAAIERESEAAPAAIGSVIAIVAAPPPPPSRISTPTLPLFAPKDTDDDAVTTSPTIAPRAPEVFVDARSAVAAPEGAAKPGRRRAFVVGGAFVAALVAVAAVAASTSAPPPIDVATPSTSTSLSTSTSTAISISAAPENSSSFRAGEAPSVEPAPAPAIVASAEIRPAIKRASAPPPAAARPPGARKKTAGSNLPADLPSERN